MLKALLKEGAIGFVALLVLIALVWIGGHFLGLSYASRGLITTLILGLWILLFIAEKVMAVRSTLEIEKRLRGQAQEQMASVRPDKKPEIQALDNQLTAAIQSLKTSKLGNGALYALPWYIIIGPPGSGKSTALQESGLNFPHTPQGGKAIRGVGGTRNCDWWFTDQAILLDTAGRYTTELDDRDEWFSFLEMLKKSRTKKPINGAMVAMAVSDVLKANDEELEAHAKNIRERIDELTKRLEIVFPVYLLFTKCDLMNGFTDYFEDYNKNDRGQVWGISLPYRAHTSQEIKTVFETECKKLYQTLIAQRVSTLASDRKSVKKRNIYTFPVQFALAQKRLADFLGMIFRDNPFAESSLLRGFYFTSGTQEGMPIDQVVGAMGQAFGMAEASQILMSQEVEKKSYFLNQLFTQVIFPDQVLARSSTSVERRRWFLRMAALFGSVVGLIVMIVLHTVSYVGNRRMMTRVEERGQAVAKSDWSRPENLEKNLQAMDAMRAEIKDLDDQDRGSPRLALRWGLYSGDKVNGKARAVYYDKLEKNFLKKVGDRLATEMDALATRPELTIKEYTDLRGLFRAYLMIIKPLPISSDATHLKSILSDWWVDCVKPAEGPVPDTWRALALRQLEFYISQLDKSDTPRLQVDTRLEDGVRAMLQVIPGLPNTYKGIEDGGKQQFQGNVPIEAIVTPMNSDLFRSGHPVSQFFTEEAWNKYTKSAFDTESKRLVQEESELKIKLNKTAKEVNDWLIDEYLRRYSLEWMDFLKGLKLREFGNLEDAQKQLDRLSSPNESPYNPIFNEIWKRLKPRPEGDAPTLAGLDRIKDGIRRFLKQAPERGNEDLGKELAWRKDVYDAIKELQVVIDGFVKSGDRAEDVRAYIRTKYGKPAEDAFIIADMKIRKACAPVDPAYRDVVISILLQPVERAKEALIKYAQEAIDTLWKAKVYDVFQKNLATKFPFSKDAKDDAAFDDFVQFFKPGGTFLTIYEQNLKVWREKQEKREGETVIRFAPATLQAIDQLLAVSEAFFSGGADAQLVFLIRFNKPPQVVGILIKVGNYQYNHPQDHTLGDWRIEWKKESTGARVLIRAGEQRTEYKVEAEGVWALFRLLAAAQKREAQSGNAALYDVEWGFPEAQTVLSATLNAQSTKHPYHKEFFTRVKLPTKVGP